MSTSPQELFLTWKALESRLWDETDKYLSPGSQPGLPAEHMLREFLRRDFGMVSAPAFLSWAGDPGSALSPLPHHGYGHSSFRLSLCPSQQPSPLTPAAWTPTPTPRASFLFLGPVFSLNSASNCPDLLGYPKHRFKAPTLDIQSFF